METNFTFINGSDQKSSYFDNKTKSNLVVTIKDPNKLTDGYTKTVIKINSDNKHDYSKDYLTFVALEDGTFAFTASIQYSIDNGNTWTQLAPNTNSPTIMAGNKILWKQTNPTIYDTAGIGSFVSTNRFNVEGNVMSLYYGDDFQDKVDLTGKNTIFLGLFFNNPNVINVENFILPATILSNFCYIYMFSGCTNLTIAPALPATTLADNCYSYMFNDCTSLTTAPELPATTLVNGCYQYMFSGCTSLTTAPELPAAILAEGCYEGMFSDNCTSLNYIKCLATNISASNCLTNWVDGVLSTGTFIKVASMNGWPSGKNGIPNGWTVEDV